MKNSFKNKSKKNIIKYGEKKGDYIYIAEKGVELFKNEVNKWYHHFGLFSWSLAIVIDDQKSVDNPNDNNILAECQYDTESKWSKIILYKKWDCIYLEDQIEYHLKRNAFHEIMHLVLSGIFHYCDYTLSRKDRQILDAEVEGLIRLFENRLFDFMVNKKEI